MLDVGFSELALIVVVTFVLLGPEELPRVIRGLSKFMRQCREVIDECKTQLDELSRETEIKETLETERKYIRDQFGELQEVYDVADIVKERQSREMIELAPEEKLHD